MSLLLPWFLSSDLFQPDEVYARQGLARAKLAQKLNYIVTTICFPRVTQSRRSFSLSASLLLTNSFHPNCTLSIFPDWREINILNSGSKTKNSLKQAGYYPAIVLPAS